MPARPAFFYVHFVMERTMLFDVPGCSRIQ